MHFKATDKIYKQKRIDFVVYRKCIPRKKIVQLNGLSWKHLFSSTIFVSAMHLPCYSLRSVSIFAWNSLIDSIEFKRPTETIHNFQVAAISANLCMRTRRNSCIWQHFINSYFSSSSNNPSGTLQLQSSSVFCFTLKIMGQTHFISHN